MRRGNIIQANEKANSWCGTVLIVDEVNERGVLAFMRIPMQGDAYIRLKHDEYDDLHATAVLLPGGE